MRHPSLETSACLLVGGGERICAFSSRRDVEWCLWQGGADKEGGGRHSPCSLEQRGVQMGDLHGKVSAAPALVLTAPVSHTASAPHVGFSLPPVSADDEARVHTVAPKALPPALGTGKASSGGDCIKDWASATHKHHPHTRDGSRKDM